MINTADAYAIHTACYCVQLIVTQQAKSMLCNTYYVQVENLYKLVGQKGKKKDAIAELTDCKITVPPLEEYDDQAGVAIVVDGRNPKKAEQMILELLCES